MPTHSLKGVLLCASVTAVLVLAGCGAKQQGNASGPAASVQPAVTAAVSSSPAATPTTAPVKRLAIQAFYSNDDASALVQKEVAIQYEKEEGKYLAALNALKKSPSTDGTSLCPHTKFISAVLQGNKLSVNLTLPDEDRLGSAGEGLLLDALRNTLFQFKEVESFEILVDGKKPESLMGHYDLPVWFTR